MKKAFVLLLSLLLLASTVNFSVVANDGFTVNVTEGQLINGEYRFIATGGDDLKIRVDTLNILATKGKTLFDFSVEGLDYAGGLLYSGETTVASLPSTSGTHSINVASDKLTEQDVTLTYIPFSNGYKYGGDMVYGTYNLDDQIVSAVSVTLADGTAVEPETVILHYPVEGSGDIRVETESYDKTKKYEIGDGWNNDTKNGGNTPDVPLYVSFTFKGLKDKIDTGVGYSNVFDTSRLPDGNHKVTVISDGKVVKEVTFATDNTGPVITIDTPFGKSLLADETISFSATDDSEVDSYKADIDGKLYQPGGDLSKFGLGKHLLTVQAKDTLGNVSVACLEFKLCEKAEDIDSSLKQQTVSPTTEGNVQEYVYDIGSAERFVFEYLGSTSENGSVSVSAYDYDSNEYVQIGVAESGIKAVFEITDTKFISNSEVKISVKPNVYVSVSDTVIWLTDTQYYSNFDDLNFIYEDVLKYSVEQFKAGKAGYFMHTGDIVDTYSPAEKAQQEWIFADNVHKILDEAKMPYGILAGNHDTNNTPADYSYFTKYFSEKRFNGNPWYGGQIDNNACHYDLVTIADTDYLFMYLGNGIEANDKTIAWANAVCKAYSDRSVILSTHAYLDTNGTYMVNPQNKNNWDHSRAYEIAEQIIAPNPNVVAMFCGHQYGVARVQREFGDDGRYVWEILADYQYAEYKGDPDDDPAHMSGSIPLDGEGFLRLVTFEKDGTMHQTTYSPVHDVYNFFAEEDDTFTVKLNLTAKGVQLNTELAEIHYEGGTNILPIVIIIACAVVCIGVIAWAVLDGKKKAK